MLLTKKVDESFKSHVGWSTKICTVILCFDVKHACTRKPVHEDKNSYIIRCQYCRYSLRNRYGTFRKISVFTIVHQW